MKIKSLILFLIIGVGLLAVLFVVDSYVLDQGESDWLIPDVGIKAATLTPTFVTATGQPVLLVYVKGEAAQVTADIARRVAPTQGGDTLETYNLEPLDLILPATNLNAEDTGEVRVWGKILEVPPTPAQYLITVTATDQKNVATKFKMFNYILSVQEESDKVAGNTPGQTTWLSFLKNINDENYAAAAELAAPELGVNAENITERYGDLKNAETLRFEETAVALSGLTETDTVWLRLADGRETSRRLEFRLNQDQPQKKWQLLAIEK
jgi:hypothetical protein